MDKDKHANILDIFTRQTRSAGEGPADKDRYHALLGAFETDDLQGNAEFLLIRREAGRESELIRYADILSVYGPVHQVLALTCAHANFQFEGQHLDAIPFYIQTRKLEILQLYVAEWHLEPPADASIISRISRDPEFTTDEDVAAMRLARQGL